MKRPDSKRSTTSGLLGRNMAQNRQPDKNI